MLYVSKDLLLDDCLQLSICVLFSDWFAIHYDVGVPPFGHDFLALVSSDAAYMFLPVLLHICCRMLTILFLSCDHFYNYIV